MTLYRMTGNKGNIITYIQHLGHRFLKIWEDKKRPKFGAIYDNFRVWPQISQEPVMISTKWHKIQRKQSLLRWRKKFGELLFTNKKSYRCRCWPTQVQNSAQFRATSNFDREYVWSWSTYWKSITNLIDCHLSCVEAKKLVNFGPLTNKLQARMLTNPKSTMRVLRMLLHLTSGHVTLLLGNFHSLELTPIGLTAPGSLTLGSAPYF